MLPKQFRRPASTNTSPSTISNAMTFARMLAQDVLASTSEIASPDCPMGGVCIFDFQPHYLLAIRLAQMLSKARGAELVAFSYQFSLRVRCNTLLCSFCLALSGGVDTLGTL
jgi:hypothetical protein